MLLEKRLKKDFLSILEKLLSGESIDETRTKAAISENRNKVIIVTSVDSLFKTLLTINVLENLDDGWKIIYSDYITVIDRNEEVNSFTLDLSQDGNYFAIGAPTDWSKSTCGCTGVVYIYYLNNPLLKLDRTYNHSIIISPTVCSDSRLFGRVISMSEDGDYVAVNSLSNNKEDGYVSIYKLDYKNELSELVGYITKYTSPNKYYNSRIGNKLNFIKSSVGVLRLDIDNFNVKIS